MKRYIIDTDTASDDALALILALREPNVKIEAITTVMGNVPIETATRNARIAVEMAGTYAPPIYEGCGRSIVAPARTAQAIHGEDGLGNMFYPDPKLPVEQEHAVDAIIRIIEEGDGDIELITLGPLTNIAMAMIMAPETMRKVKRITTMGGAHMRCNPLTATSEFNILVDPEAAQLVWSFGIPILVAPFELCLSPTALTEKEIDEIYSYGSPLAKFVIDCNNTLIDYIARVYGERKLVMPDPTAVAVALWPETIAQSTECYSYVDTKGEHTYGQTVFDYNNVAGKPHNVTVVDTMDCELFKKIAVNKFTVNR